MFKLVIIDGEQSGKNILLQENQEITIGREDCEFQIFSEGVSRKHCKAMLSNGIVYFQDLGSRNGTYINKLPITTITPLELENVVCVGDTRVILQKVSQAQPQAITTEMETGEVAILHQKKRSTSTFFIDTKETSIEVSQLKQDLLILHKIGKLAQTPTNIKGLLVSFLKTVLVDFSATSGHIFIKTISNQPYNISFFCSLNNGQCSEESFPINQTVLNSVLNSKEGNVAVSQTCGTIICACIESYSNTLGIIYLTAKQAVFDNRSLDLLTALGKHIALALEKLFFEQQLKASEQHYRLMCQSFIANSWDVLYRRGLNGKFFVLSPSIQNLIGFSAHAVVQNVELWEQAIHPQYKNIVANTYKKALAGEQYRQEFKIITPDKSEVWIEDTCHPIKDEKGNIVCVQGIYKNITNTKHLLEKLGKAQKMEIVGTLAGGIAHDLNNIFGVLIGYPDIILQSLPENEEIKKCALNIQQAAKRALDIVSDLNAMSRRNNYSIKDLDLNEEVKHYLNSIAVTTFTKNNHISFRTQFSEKVLRIRGSSSHLYKVIMNLVNNAIQAMPTGGTLTIAVDKVDTQDKKYAVLCISDTGCGISQENVEKIFDPFYSSKVDSGGTGLGLVVVQSVIEDHNGYTDVKSVVGEGTTFSIYLPLFT